MYENVLVHSYELLNMCENESIYEMFTPFINIVSGLKAHDRDISNVELVNKIIRSFPRNWDERLMPFWKQMIPPNVNSTN